MRCFALVLAALAGCDASTVAVTCGDGTTLEDNECVAPLPMPPTCDAGTHAQGGVCIPDQRARYEIKVAPKVAGDGVARNRVLVVGTNPDGTPATDALVLNIDRSGGGAYTDPTVTPGALGAETYFTACNQAIPGCLGLLRLTAALASAPTTVIASTQIEVVAPAVVSPAARCLIGGNVLYLKGNDSIFTGETTITGATWTFDAVYADMLTTTVRPSGSSGAWQLGFYTMFFVSVMTPNAYEDARRALFGPPFVEVDDHPSMSIRGFANECMTITGRFDVVAYDHNASNHTVSKVTIAFEQFCNGSTSASLTGCMHYEQ